MRNLVFLTVALAAMGLTCSAYGQGSDLQGRLKQQFIVARVDGGDITSPGTMVTLRKGGFWTYSTASPVPYLNNYDKGKISQPFFKNVGAGVAGGLVSNNTQFPQRLFQPGANFSIIGLLFQNDGFTLRLCSDSYDGIRYYGDLKFGFRKGSPPAPDDALARIAEVLAASTTPPTQVADKGDGPTPTPPPIASPAAQLHLPATYVNAQSATDKLQLNADNSFSLQEAGQSYSGTFSANGSTIELNIRDGPKTTLTIQGSNLTDGGGQTWLLQEQSAQPVPDAGVLKNQDVIALTKAGLDDATILAKIASSICQFDTSTDALIQLRQSGVSAAVLKAMVRAGR